jgi:hypothetical protein
LGHALRERRVRVLFDPLGGVRSLGHVEHIAPGSMAATRLASFRRANDLSVVPSE